MLVTAISLTSTRDKINYYRSRYKPHYAIDFIIIERLNSVHHEIFIAGFTV